MSSLAKDIKSFLKFQGKSGLPTKPITDDDADRIALCIKVLSEQSPTISEVFDVECRTALGAMLEAQQEVIVSLLFVRVSLDFG